VAKQYKAAHKRKVKRYRLEALSGYDRKCERRKLRQALRFKYAVNVCIGKEIKGEFLVGRKEKRKKGIAPQRPAAKKMKVSDLAQSRTIQKQSAVLAKLANWQEDSANTSWVIGECLDVS
jgi:hypothetical protein